MRRWLILLLACCLVGSVARASTYTVDSLLDTDDATPGDDLCDDGSGNCTQRAAITEANTHAGPDTIHYSVSGTTTMGSDYPFVTEQLTATDLRATCTGCGWGGCSPTTLFTIDSAGFFAFNFISTSGGSHTVNGLKILGAGRAIYFDQIDGSTASCNVIDGAMRGIELNGANDTTVSGNRVVNIVNDGISTHGEVSTPLVLNHGNLIFDNECVGNPEGIAVSQVEAAGGNTLVHDNRATGITSGSGVGVGETTGGLLITHNWLAGNTSFGIGLGADSDNVTIGGADLSVANVIIGNVTGIGIAPGATSTTIQNNYVGVEDDATTCVPNTQDFSDAGTGTSGAACGSNGNVCCPATPTPTPAPDGCCVVTDSDSMSSFCRDLLGGFGASPIDGGDNVCLGTDAGFAVPEANCQNIGTDIPGCEFVRWAAGGLCGDDCLSGATPTATPTITPTPTPTPRAARGRRRCVPRSLDSDLSLHCAQGEPWFGF